MGGEPMDGGLMDGVGMPERGLQVRSQVTDAGTVELSLAEIAIPAPGPDQVLVRVEAAPVNPSDLALLLAGADPASFSAARGDGDRPTAVAALPPAAVRAATARVGQSLPVGNEGAGTVVAAGAGDASQALLGRVVAAAGGAMYAQYRVLDASSVLVLPEGTTAAEGASSFVNPLTALAMVETMRAEGHTALVHTAAASNLGQMLQRVCLEDGVPLVDVVRSPAQAELLRDLGAQHVVDTSAEGYMGHLVSAISATGATLGFDAIGGGKLAGQILTAMEAAASAGREYSRYGSTVHKQVYIYGALDRGPTELSRNFGMAWGLGGWLLTPFLLEAGPQKVDELRRRVAAGVKTTFASRYGSTVDLFGALDPEAIAAYGRQATGAKTLITPAS